MPTSRPNTTIPAPKTPDRTAFLAGHRIDLDAKRELLQALASGTLTATHRAILYEAIQSQTTDALATDVTLPRATVQAARAHVIEAVYGVPGSELPDRGAARALLRDLDAALLKRSFPED